MNSENRFSNKIGEEYNLFKMAVPHMDNLEKETVETFSKSFSDSSTLKVLEIGFGTGITTEKLLEDERNNIVGVDSEPKMLEQATEKLHKINPKRFKLQIIDALEFLKSQPDNFFDGVVSVWVLHNINDDLRKQILKEAYRTLPNGGLFINGDKIAVIDEVEHAKQLEWQINQFNVFDRIKRPDLKTEWIEHYMEDEKPNKILFVNEFSKDLEALGFNKITIHNRFYLDAIVSAVK